MCNSHWGVQYLWKSFNERRAKVQHDKWPRLVDVAQPFSVSPFSSFVWLLLHLYIIDQRDGGNNRREYHTMSIVVTWFETRIYLHFCTTFLHKVIKDTCWWNNKWTLHIYQNSYVLWTECHFYHSSDCESLEVKNMQCEWHHATFRLPNNQTAAILKPDSFHVKDISTVVAFWVITMLKSNEKATFWELSKVKNKAKMVWLSLCAQATTTLSGNTLTPLSVSANVLHRKFFCTCVSW